MKRNGVPTDQRLRVKPVTAAIAMLLGSGYGATVAFAQSDEIARQLTIEEITVTASRRETKVQELPFNIAAFGGAALERQRVSNLAELARWVPGLTVVDQGARAASLMTVRGLNVRSVDASEFLDNGGGGTVATYLGEIPLYVDFKMKDLERVEVLMGPQGTLYGAGTLGGAVRYIPVAPDTQDFTFDVHGDLYGVEQSSALGYQADAVINAPLIEDRLAFRGAFAYFDDPGFIDYPFVVRQPGVSNPQPDFDDPADVAANLRHEADVDWEHTLSGRLALLWQVNDAVHSTFNYYFQNQEAGGRSVNQRDAFDTGNYEAGLRFLEPSDRDNGLLSVEVVADLGFAELTSATGFSEYDQLGQRDQTDLLLDFGYGYEEFPEFVAFTRDAANEERVNEEVRLVSKSGGPLNWIGGIFYNDYELNDSSEEYTPGFPAFAGFFVPTGDLEYRQTRRQTLTEQAVFGEIGYQFTDRWQTTIGGRWFDYEFGGSAAFFIPFYDDSDTTASQVEDDGFLAKLNTSYAFTTDVMGYVTVSEGYRNGSANGVPACVFPLPPGQNACALPEEVLIKPDTTTNYEVGMHSTWDDGDLIFNGAVYLIDWDDIQTDSNTVNGDLPITVNGSSARSRGLELALQTQHFDRWALTGAYAYNEAELTADAAGLVDGVDAFAGDRLSGTPEHQGSLAASYYRTLRNGWDLDLGYGVTFSGDVLTKVGLRNDGETLGGYAVHGISAGLSDGRWSAALYADNLTNKFAETAVRLDPTTIRDVGDFALRKYYRHVLRPRSVGVEIRYSLGK